MSSAPELTLLLEVHEDESPMRLDHCLLAKIRETSPELSRAKLKESFRAGRIHFRGRAADASALLGPGTHEIKLLDWNSAPTRELRAQASPRGCFLPIVFEDERLLILNKLSGVPSVPHDASETDTAVNAALAHCPALSEEGRDPLEPGLLHRLDTGTSGLLAFAKTSDEFERLRKAWKTRAVRKTYRALTVLPPNGADFKVPHTFKLLVGHDAGSSKRMKVLGQEHPGAWELKQVRGKPLETVTRVCEIKLLGPGMGADFVVEIETGVMHQIRSVLAWSGCPILGDAIYGGAASERLWLHAWRLALPLEKGGKIEFEAPLPEGWGKTLA